jgi:hypothetical protein
MTTTHWILFGSDLQVRTHTSARTLESGSDHKQTFRNVPLMSATSARWKQAEHSRHLGRRHRANQSQLLLVRPCGLQNAEHRPDSQGRDDVHGLLCRELMHGGPLNIHHRPLAYNRLSVDDHPVCPNRGPDKIDVARATLPSMLWKA